MRRPRQERRAVHRAQRAPALGHEAGLLDKLSTGAGLRIFVTVERAGRHLPRRHVPRVPPLADKHRVAVVEPRHDERGIRALDDGMERLDAVGKSNDVVTQDESLRCAAGVRRHDMEWPAARWMDEPRYRLTIVSRRQIELTPKDWSSWRRSMRQPPPLRRRGADRVHSRRATRR